MVLCKTAVAPLLTHWSYCSLTLSHRTVGAKSAEFFTVDPWSLDQADLLWSNALFSLMDLAPRSLVTIVVIKPWIVEHYFFGSILNVKVLMAWQGMVCQVVIDRNDKVYFINAGIILCVGPANETQRYIVTSSLWLGAYKKMIPVMTHEGWFGIVKNAKILHSFHFISSVFFSLILKCLLCPLTFNLHSFRIFCLYNVGYL